MHMHTAQDSLAHIFSGDARLDDALSYRLQINYEPFIPMMQMEPYLRSLLRYLRPAYKTAVVTNRSDTIDGVLEEHGLEGQFDLVVSSLDVTHPKPHPESLLKALEHFGLLSREAVYIGDSEVDEQAAIAAQVPLAAYKNRSLSAALHLEHFRDVETFLEKKGGAGR